MKRIKLRVPAKINLTLDVVGESNGFHNLKSLVTTVDIYDRITLTKREDKNITLLEKGLVCGADFEKNNAVKSAKLFLEKTGVNGVDIVLEKSIAVGGGLGGSSADIAGVLYGMNLLYKTNADIISLANQLGSDAGYMTVGGYAVLKNRGDIFEKISVEKTLWVLIVKDEKSILAKDSYSWYDEDKITANPCTEKCVEFLQNNDVENLCKNAKNDLYFATEKRYPELKEKLQELTRVGAKASLMTGSGSVVYGIFDKECDLEQGFKAFDGKYANFLQKAKSCGGIEVLETE